MAGAFGGGLDQSAFALAAAAAGDCSFDGDAFDIGALDACGDQTTDGRHAVRVITRQPRKPTFVEDFDELFALI